MAYRYPAGRLVREHLDEDEDEAAIARLPEAAWETFLKQDGFLQECYFVAEPTGLNTREGWPEGTRLIVRRVKPSGRQVKKLTTSERKTGWRYSVTATNISRMRGRRRLPPAAVPRRPAPCSR